MAYKQTTIYNEQLYILSIIYYIINNLLHPYGKLLEGKEINNIHDILGNSRFG